MQWGWAQGTHKSFSQRRNSECCSVFKIRCQITLFDHLGYDAIKNNFPLSSKISCAHRERRNTMNVITFLHLRLSTCMWTEVLLTEGVCASSGSDGPVSLLHLAGSHLLWHLHWHLLGLRTHGALEATFTLNSFPTPTAPDQPPLFPPVYKNNWPGSSSHTSLWVNLILFGWVSSLLL